MISKLSLLALVLYPGDSGLPMTVWAGPAWQDGWFATPPTRGF